MSSKNSPHKHGLSSVHILRKKSTESTRRNKALARDRRIERHAELAKVHQEALAKLGE
ncbi:MAG TPA: hypothetical protein PLQ36_00980 [Candidatus Gracilibacteria bacterium]|nr:hypothetical protein [Candidatus Gracilibacteria bacterium]